MEAFCVFGGDDDGLSVAASMRRNPKAEDED